LFCFLLAIFFIIIFSTISTSVSYFEYILGSDLSETLYQNLFKYETDVDIVEKIIIKNIANKKQNNSLLSVINLPGLSVHKKLMKEVDSRRADIGFFICPMPMKKIMSIADRGKIVPKKSTYFDPKPADGLVNLLMDI
jgi:uncharacterized protein (DUF1015 family)